MKLTHSLAAAFLLFAQSAAANEDIPDQYPSSVLYQHPVEVIPGVFSAIGATAPPTYENAGHNNNLSFIVTGEGVVVVNSGASYELAEALHAEIKEVTDEPVVAVFCENGQGHAMLGNAYWIAQNVPVIAHVDAIAEFEHTAGSALQAAQRVAQENAARTTVAMPSESFSDAYTLELGAFTIEARYLGPAHSPGDIVVWLPKQGLVISGDMAFHERMLPIFVHTDTAGWIDTWETAFEPLGAAYVIPGHGHPTNMAQVRRYTHDYLAYLREKIGAHIESGGDLSDAYYVDQSPYRHLDTFEELATKNAGRVYEQMEFDF